MIVVTGYNKAGRSTLYKGLESVLPGLYPEYEFEFLGTPFGALENRHPLHNKGGAGHHATSQLLEAWVSLNETTLLLVKPALDAGKHVVLDGFGLDVLLRIIGNTPCDDECRAAARFHHALVKERISGQGIPLPQYLVVTAHAHEIAARINHDVGTVAGLLQRQALAIAEYFDGTGQLPPIMLDPAESPEMRLMHAVEALQRDFGGKMPIAA